MIAMLEIRKWKGHVSSNPNIYHFSDTKPSFIGSMNYSFDLNKDNEYCWLNEHDKKQYSFNQVIDSNIKWFVDEVSKNVLKKL